MMTRTIGKPNSRDKILAYLKTGGKTIQEIMEHVKLARTTILEHIDLLVAWKKVSKFKIRDRKVGRRRIIYFIYGEGEDLA